MCMPPAVLVGWARKPADLNIGGPRYRGSFFYDIAKATVIRLAQALRICGLPAGLLSIEQVAEGIQKLKKTTTVVER